MLSLLFIFIFTLLWALILIYIIDRIFKLIYKLKIRKKSGLFIFWLLIYLGLFVASIIFVFYTATVAVEILKRQPQNNSLALNQLESTIARETCHRLLDNIYASEDALHKFENHRYIEQLSPSFIGLLEYKKGAEKLKIMADSYDKLNLNAEARKYSNAIDLSMNEKAKLFEERSKITTNTKEAKQKINELLFNMDRATSQRAAIIDRVKQQCNSSP